MTNKSIIALKDKDKATFINSIKYIFNNIQVREYEIFADYSYSVLSLTENNIPFVRDFMKKPKKRKEVDFDEN